MHSQSRDVRQDRENGKGTTPPESSVAAGADGATGDPREQSPKRQQILAGAREVFLTLGFERASMQDVARASGVSKATLYVYFEHKEAIFEAIVLNECGRMSAEILALAPGSGELGVELRAIARHLARALLSHDVLASIRMMIGAAERFPELARKVYAAGPQQSVRTIGAYLQRRIDAGELRACNAELAAAQFVDLCIARLQRRAFLMVETETAEDILIEAGVDSFLRAYAVRPAAG